MNINLQPKKHMKTTTSIIAATSIALLTASCEKKTVTTEANSTTTTTEATAAATDNYPLKTCVVSGEKLGEMGVPYVHVHEGTTVKLCCKSCLKDFNENPAKYITMIKDAEKSTPPSQ